MRATGNEQRDARRQQGLDPFAHGSAPDGGAVKVVSGVFELINLEIEGCA